ncbi:MAG TPA: phosphate ABC transporter ATP-binding protein [Anaerolineae bacterium]|nr:phosphate ABC transporter ATP-binding protein [Anaerolineae bacterium]
MVAKFSIHNLTFEYGGSVALQDVTLDIPANQVTVIFGPSHAGKSTLMRCLNRLNDLIEYEVISRTGQILLDGQDIHAPGVDVTDLRRRVGMVFALPIPLPLTIYENVTYGPRMAGERRQARLDDLVERSLRQAALWDEVKDRLHDPAMRLSGGQQQRLCIARTLSLQPEVILLDNPTSGLDPISTAKVENSLQELKVEYTIVLVPHSVQQAARVADLAAFLLGGELVEVGSGAEIFTRPRNRRTEDYITGRFG